MSALPEISGNSQENRHSLLLRDSAKERPLSQAWMTDDLLAETRRVWSQAYGRVLTDEQAVEILTNVKGLAEVLLRAKRKG